MRLRAPLLLSLLALILQACSVTWDEEQLEAHIVRPGNFKAGSGVIQSVAVVPGAREPGTGADAKGRHPDRNLYRLFLHMDGGGFQSVDIDNSRFLAGEAVELTNDGRVVRITGTTLNKALSQDR